MEGQVLAAALHAMPIAMPMPVAMPMTAPIVVIIIMIIGGRPIQLASTQQLQRHSPIRRIEDGQGRGEAAGADVLAAVPDIGDLLDLLPHHLVLSLAQPLHDDLLDLQEGIDLVFILRLGLELLRLVVHSLILGDLAGVDQAGDAGFHEVEVVEGIIVDLQRGLIHNA